VDRFKSVVVIGVVMVKGRYCSFSDESEFEIDRSGGGEPSEDTDEGDDGVGLVSGDEIGVLITGDGKGVSGDVERGSEGDV